VALCIDPQLVVSIRQKAKSGEAESGFHRVLLAESKHKRQPLPCMTQRFWAHCSAVTLLCDLHHSAPSLPASDSDDDTPDAARDDLQRSRSHVRTVHRVWTAFHDTGGRVVRSPESDVGFLQCIRSPRMHQPSLINAWLGHYQFRDSPPCCHRCPLPLFCRSFNLP
jgi:hypothetical protein